MDGPNQVQDDEQLKEPSAMPFKQLDNQGTVEYGSDSQIEVRSLQF